MKQALYLQANTYLTCSGTCLDSMRACSRPETSHGHYTLTYTAVVTMSVNRWFTMTPYPESKLRGVLGLLWWFWCNFPFDNAGADGAFSPYLPKSWLEFLKDVPFPPSSSCSAMKIRNPLPLPPPLPHTRWHIITTPTEVCISKSRFSCL